MKSHPPSKFAINHDGDHAKYVGQTADGKQFFLGTPFEPGGREFVALYLFDSSGALVEARIEEFGHRQSVDLKARNTAFDMMLEEIGPVQFGRITIAPFEIERFGVVFGFVPRVPEESDEPWVIEEQPGNCMAFFPPWDSGDYDT